MTERTPPDQETPTGNGQPWSGRISILPEGRQGNTEATLILEGNTGQLIFKGILIDGTSADLTIGTEGQAGDIKVRNADGHTSIHLDGQAGDIILSNADFAEDFDISPAAIAQVDPGTVMVLDENGALRESHRAYDKKVAGVISGAGDYRPGIIMDKQLPGPHRLPIALVGKVYCKVDADPGPIEVGDLLTTSDRPGHAMKATDPIRAFGAIIGKALQSRDEGQGMIAMLVSLQ